MADQEHSSVQPATGRMLKCKMCLKESEEMVSPSSPGGFDLRWEKGNSRLIWTHLIDNLRILLKSPECSKF